MIEGKGSALVLIIVFLVSDVMHNRPFLLLDIGGLQILILRDGIEAGTGLFDPRQVAVAEDLGFGIVGLQRAEKGDEGMFLGGSTGVGDMAVLVVAALVADTDAVRVVLGAYVGTHHLLGSSLMHLAVAGDVVVVAAALPAFSFVTGIQRLEGERAVAACRRTMNDNQIYSSHRELNKKN